jgi:hypothetical protein
MAASVDRPGARYNIGQSDWARADADSVNNFAFHLEYSGAVQKDCEIATNYCMSEILSRRNITVKNEDRRFWNPRFCQPGR